MSSVGGARKALKRPRGTATPGATAAADVSRHSIRVVSRLTSIQLDTLRVWERRYGFPSPARSDGGIRLYSDADVEALRLIVRAMELGHRPGEVVGKPREELVRLVGASFPRQMATDEGRVDSLVAAVARDDMDTLRAELRNAAILLGARRFVMDVAQPIAVKVGALWSEGKLEVRHEHMLTECLSSQLRVLRSAYEDREGTPRVLLATLPNERHGLGLEMVDVYLAVNQVRSRLLGVDTPAAQIVKAADGHGADAVGLLVTEASDLAVTSDQVTWMLTKLPRGKRLWLGGAGASHIEVRHGSLRTVRRWTDLDGAIQELRRP